MNSAIAEVPKEKLKQIVEKNGESLLQDPERCEGLLKDHCGTYKREISALVGALQERVPLELKSSWHSAMTPEAMRARLVQRLEENRGLAPDVANWAVDAWSYALDVRLPQGQSGTIPGAAAAGFAAGAAGLSVAERVASDRVPGKGEGWTPVEGPIIASSGDGKKSTLRKMAVGGVLLLGLAGAAFAFMHYPASDDNAQPPAPVPAPAPAPKVHPAPPGQVHKGSDAHVAGRREANPVRPPYQGPEHSSSGEGSGSGSVASGASAVQLKQASDRMIGLSARADAASSSIEQMERQQQAQGYGMRGDIVAAMSRMRSYLAAANQALGRQDAAGANDAMDRAEREVSTLENFLGR